MKKILTTMVLGLAQWMASTPALAHDVNEHQIARVLKQQFDRPDAKLIVDPVVIEGNVAVASWQQAGRGGRAFLEKHHDQWSIVLCAGAGLKEADVLQSIGLSAEVATRLAHAVQEADREMDADERQRFDSFEGVIKVDGANHGNPHAHHPTPTSPTQNP